MKNFFTSDTHFGHANIIKYCDRPFSSVEEMDEELILRWNRVVSPDDTVYHIGDFGFYPWQKIEEILNRLNGDILFIPGNHDKPLKRALIAGSFIKKRILTDSIYTETFSVEDERIRFVMCHYAMRVWDKSHYGAIHLYGHSHGTMPEDNSKSMDVGVDTNNYYPYSLDDILVKMYKKSIAIVDHHDRNTN